MTESENTESSREPSIHHMKMATLKDWLLNIEHGYINMDVDSDSSQQQQQNILSDFEFYKDDKRKQSTASSADELFLEGKLLPLETVQKHHHHNNNAAATASATAALDHAMSQSLIEDSTIPRSTGNADSNNIISPPHSRRFSSSDANISEYQFNEFPSDLTKRSWSLRRKQNKQNKQSWLVQKLKASRAYIKSLFSNSASSEKDKSCRCSDSTADNKSNNVVGGSAGKNKPEPNVEHAAAVDGDARKGSFENMDDDSAVANTFSKSLHDDIAGGFGSSSRRMSFSGVLKRHFSSSRGSNLMMMTSGAAAAAATATGNSSGSSSNSSSFSLGCKELKAVKNSVSAAALHHQQQHRDVEKSVEGAIAHCKLSQQKGSELKIAPKAAASGNQDVAPHPGLRETHRIEIIRN